MLKNAYHIYPYTQKKYLPITKNIFVKIISVILISIEKINIDIAFKVAWVGFLKLDEITYINAKAQAFAFVEIKLTCLDIIFADDNQHIILRLKQNKINFNHTRVKIVLAAIHDKTCPVTAFYTFFSKNLQLCMAPLFCLIGKSIAFDKNSIINTL